MSYEPLFKKTAAASCVLISPLISIFVYVCTNFLYVHYFLLHFNIPEFNTVMILFSKGLCRCILYCAMFLSPINLTLVFNKGQLTIV